MWPKISWQTNLTFPGNNLSQTISRSTCHKQNTTSGQVVLQANHPKNSWDLNHPQVPVIPRSSRVDQYTRTFNKITKQHQMECIKLIPLSFHFVIYSKCKKPRNAINPQFFSMNCLTQTLGFSVLLTISMLEKSNNNPLSMCISPWRCRWPHFQGLMLPVFNRIARRNPLRDEQFPLIKRIPKPSPTKPRSRGADASHGPWASVPARPTRSSFCHRWNSASPIFFQTIFSQSSWATAYQFPENGV